MYNPALVFEALLPGNMMQQSVNNTHAVKEKYDFNKLQKKLRANVGRAISDFNMIEDGDRIMVCLSGGADSYTLLEILQNLQRSAPVKFELIAVNLDQKQPGFPEHILPEYLDKLGIEYYIVNRDTYSVVTSKIDEGKTMCSLCSRLRRGTLYSFAEEINANKIALGHHKDDIVETMFLNMFYGSRLSAMPPKLLSDDKRNIVIRPLAYCRERDIKRFAEIKAFPIIPCNLCGSQENLQRQNIKAMLAGWEASYPSRIEAIFSALQNVAPSQLADTSLFNFTDLRINRSDAKGDYEYADQQTVFDGQKGTLFGADSNGKSAAEKLISAVNIVEAAN